MLKHGILGLLNYGEMTGYEIREAFRSSLNFVWPAQSSQIYRELDALEQRGWLEKRTVAQAGRPDKHVCSITEAGRQELLRWLAEERAEIGMRSALLMHVFFLGELPAGAQLDFFRRLQGTLAQTAQALQQTDDSIRAYGNLVPDGEKTQFWAMTADLGKRYVQMYADWTNDCIQRLEGME